MKALWAFLLGCSVLTVTTRSETPLRLHVGGSAGYVAFDPLSRTIGPLSLPPTSELIGSSIAGAFALHAGLDIPLSPLFSLRTTIGFATMQNSVSASEPTLFNQGGDTIRGRFEHNADVGWSWGTAMASIVWHVGTRWRLEAGGGVCIPFAGTINATETIAEPPGITYVNGGTVRTTAAGAIESDALSGMLYAGVYLNSQISDRWQFELGPYACLMLSSFTDEATVRPSSFGLSGSMSFALSAPSSEITYKTAMRADTIVVVDPFDPLQRSVRYVEVSRTVAMDTMQTKTGMVIVANTISKIEKHLPSPPPFLSIVVRADLDTVSVATTPHVVVQTDVVSDDGIQSISLWGIINSDTIWADTFSSEHREVIRWSFEKLPARYVNEAAFTIRVEALAVDKRGQKQRARPASISITRVLQR